VAWSGQTEKAFLLPERFRPEVQLGDTVQADEKNMNRDDEATVGSTPL
jgi:hypothetical protein